MRDSSLQLKPLLQQLINYELIIILRCKMQLETQYHKSIIFRKEHRPGSYNFAVRLNCY